MPKNKMKVTKVTVGKAKRLFKRVLKLQGDMYDFKDFLIEKMDREDLGQEISDGAFEMDLTWNNAERVFNLLQELYDKEKH